jgi:iron complex transport system ATP-binding protein
VVALHDLNLAATYCDHLVVLSEGRVVTCGEPAEVLTADLVAKVYRVDAEITPAGPAGRPHVRFRGTLPG